MFMFLFVIVYDICVLMIFLWLFFLVVHNFYNDFDDFSLFLNSFLNDGSSFLFMIGMIYEIMLHVFNDLFCIDFNEFVSFVFRFLLFLNLVNIDIVNFVCARCWARYSSGQDFGFVGMCVGTAAQKHKYQSHSFAPVNQVGGLASIRIRLRTRILPLHVNLRRHHGKYDVDLSFQGTWDQDRSWTGGSRADEWTSGCNVRYLGVSIRSDGHTCGISNDDMCSATVAFLHVSMLLLLEDVQTRLVLQRRRNSCPNWSQRRVAIGLGRVALCYR